VEIAIVHTGESHDRIHVVRDDGSEASWRWPAGGPPHDLIHWVVESELGMRLGFWGRVAAGADFGFHDAAHERRGEPPGGDPRELLQAEGCVNGIQICMGLDPRPSEEECLEYAKRACEQAGVGLPAGLDAKRYGELRRSVEEWVARYRRLDPGEALRLTYDA